MIILFTTIVIIVFLPIISTIFIYYDYKLKKLFFAIYIFKIIKLASGYFNKRELGGFYLHISNKKVIILDEEFIKNFGKGPDFIPNFQIFNIYTVVDSGVDSHVWLSFLFLLYKLSQILSKIICNNVKFLKVKTNLNLYEKNENLISIKCQILSCFNVFSIIYSYFANIIKRGKRYAKKKL